MTKNLKFLFKYILFYKDSSFRKKRKSEDKSKLEWIFVLVPPIVWELLKTLRYFYIILFKSEVVAVKLKDIISYYDYLDLDFIDLQIELMEDEDRSDSDLTRYEWKSLIESIKNEGIKRPIVLYNNPVSEEFEEYKKYRVDDGNHRIRVLKHLYGDDHEIDVIIYNRYKEKNFKGKPNEFK